VKVISFVNIIIDLLQKRVSETFVNDSINVLESKIIREIDKIKQRDTEKQEKMHKDTQSQISALSKFNTEEFSGLRSRMTYFEQLISKKVSPEDIKSLSNTVKDVKYGFERESEAVMEHVNKLEDKFSEFGRRFNVIESYSKNAKDKQVTDLESKNSQK
jgi:hypothetical protein